MDKKNFKKTLKVSIAALATTTFLAGCNIEKNQKDPEITIEISNDRFEKLLKEYIVRNENSNLSREDQDYIVDHYEELSNEVIEEVDEKILDCINKESVIYQNIEYSQDEKKNCFLEFTGENKEKKRMKVENKVTQLIDNVLELQRLNEDNTRKIPIIAQSDRVKSLLHITKQVSDIFENNKMIEKNGTLELQESKPKEEIMEIGEN